MDEVAPSYVDNPIPFLRSVLGACSITKTVLQHFGYLDPDPDEKNQDYRSDLELMYQLCLSNDVPTEPLDNLKKLLDLFDTFKQQDRNVKAEQVSAAAPLHQSYCTWCKETFFEQEN